jgi:ketosteroid isomerase-like protein
MSAKNVEIVRRANALFNAGDVEAGLELVHPNVVFRDLQNAPDLPEVLEGRDSLARVLAHWVDVYDEFSAEVYDYVDADPWVIADVRWHGKGKGSELRVDVRQADMCRVQDGRVVEWIVGYPDMATALEATGSSGG